MPNTPEASTSTVPIQPLFGMDEQTAAARLGFLVADITPVVQGLESRGSRYFPRQNEHLLTPDLRKLCLGGTSYSLLGDRPPTYPGFHTLTATLGAFAAGEHADTAIDMAREAAQVLTDTKTAVLARTIGAVAMAVTQQPTNKLLEATSRQSNSPNRATLERNILLAPTTSSERGSIQATATFRRLTFGEIQLAAVEPPYIPGSLTSKPGMLRSGRESWGLQSATIALQPSNQQYNADAGIWLTVTSQLRSNGFDLNLSGQSSDHNAAYSYDGRPYSGYARSEVYPEALRLYTTAQWRRKDIADPLDYAAPLATLGKDVRELVEALPPEVRLRANDIYMHSLDHLEPEYRTHRQQIK